MVLTNPLICQTDIVSNVVGEGKKNHFAESRSGMPVMGIRKQDKQKEIVY